MKRHGSVNRVYRLIWSAVRNVWIPVAEKARGRGKCSAGKLIATVLCAGATAAQAAPFGGQVIGGSGTIVRAGATTTITQASANLALNWKSFDIAPQETVNFLQPSTSAIAVNRIFDTNGTQILGHLTANGQVFLINANRIVFGPSAEVNVGALIASTLDIDYAASPGLAHGQISTLFKDKRTAFDAQPPALRFVNGGVRLPDNLVNANAL